MISVLVNSPRLDSLLLYGERERRGGGGGGVVRGIVPFLKEY